MSSHRIAGSSIGYPLNCDSQLFVQAGLDPSLLATTAHPFQSRPLYFAVPAVVGLTGDADLVFKTYQMMNLAFLAFAVWLLGRLVGGPHGWWLTVVPLLVLNDIVKAFVWTPHTQILNITVPVVGMWLLSQLAPHRRMRWYAGTGLALGLGLLVYGAVIPVVGAALLLMVWQRGEYTLRQAGALLGMAALPVVVWVGTVTAIRGRFDSYETSTHRQFVWLAELDLPRIILNTRTWLLHTFEAAALAALLAGVGLLLARRCGWRPEPQLVRVAVVLTVAIAGFTWSLGFAPARLTWAIGAPLIVVSAIALSSVQLPRWQRVAYAAAVVAWAVWQVVTPGPWA